MLSSLSRNIAVVSAIFIATFSIMLITNYFQISSADTLQLEAIEKLKQMNDERGDDAQLLEQIRELDLLARKAYFVSLSRLKSGVAILLVMTVIFVVCLRVYFANSRDLPDKEVDPVDEWIIKSKTRRYVVWATGALALGGVLFALLTSPYMREAGKSKRGAERFLPDAESLLTANDAVLATDASGVATDVSGIATDVSGIATNVSGAATDVSGIATNASGTATDVSGIATDASGVATDASGMATDASGMTQQQGGASVPANAASISQVNTPVEGARQAVTPPSDPDAIEASSATHNGFRGNYSLGISNAKNVPTSWDLSSGKNILWKIETPRKGHNSPVIHGNSVYFTGADHDVRELFCFDLHSGKEKWRLTIQNVPGSSTQMPEISEETSYAASGVVTNGKQVCAIFPNGEVICADTNGKQLWTKNLGVPDNIYGYASSLLIYNNQLFIQYDNHDAKKVVALDLSNGNQRWSQTRPERNPSWSSPIIAMVNNQPQLILIGNPGVTSYNPNNGAQNWRVVCMSGEPAAGAAYANGIVFVATEYAALTAINAADGAILWKENEFLPEVASPVATKDFVFIATGYGIVATHDAQTGKMVKYMELNATFYSSPIIAENKIYLISNEGEVYIFSAEREFKLITSFQTGETTFATPAFTDKKIVIRTEEHIYCVENK